MTGYYSAVCRLDMKVTYEPIYLKARDNRNDTQVILSDFQTLNSKLMNWLNKKAEIEL
jgi:hypothetical protein